MDTALNMVRMLDSLFGTVQHIHEAQMRSQITHEALNAIAHSLGNRSDRLADTHKDCARDLYLQKLVAQGAANAISSAGKTALRRICAALRRS